MKKSHLFVLLILPAVLVFTAALLRYSQGPYWITYNSYDPEYLYIVSSLALAEDKEMRTTGNPGTTLQILGAVTLKISHALDLSEKDSLEFSVLKNPEFYLTVINIILITLNVVLLFIIGWVTFALTKNIYLSLLLQLSPFLSDIMLTRGLARVCTEPLLLFSSFLFVLILVKMVLDKNFSKTAHWYMMALSFVSGFGLATKLTFIPLLIIPVFVLPKLRNKIGFLLLTGLSFVFFTWPIMSQYKNLLNWYYRIITHTGYYGSGSPEIINTSIYFYNIKNLLFSNLFFFLVWVLAVSFILKIGLASARERNAEGRNTWHDTCPRILLSATVAQLSAVLAVAKFSNEYYLLPVMSLSGFMLFLMFMYYLRRLNYLSRLNTKVVAFIIGIFLVFGSVWRIYDIKNVFMQNLQIKKESLIIYEKAENEYKNYLKIHSVLLSSSPISALAFGNYFINEGMYSESLQKIYGESYFYGLNGEFHTWTKFFSIEDIILKGNNDKIVFFSPTEFGKIIKCSTGSILHLRDIFGGEYQTIYTLEGITLFKKKKNVPTEPISPRFNFYGSLFKVTNN